MPKNVIDFSCRAGSAGIQRMTSKQKLIFDAHGHYCHYCGSVDGLVLDHKVPKSKGGSGDPSNLLPCCSSCNSSKRNKEYGDFVEWLEAERAAYEAMVMCGDCI